jgi:membrane fusion protein, multidrug efflux system
MANETPGEHSSSPPETEAPQADRRVQRPWYRRPWVLVLAALLVGLFLVRHFSKPAPKSAGGRGEQGTPTITVAQSRTGDANIYVVALGTVTPTYTVSMYSQITGRVMAVHYREGQMVKRGDPLIDIDPRPSEATLRQAEGNLQHDKGLLAQARIDLQRYQDAYARNAIAKQQLDDQQQTVIQYEGTVQADEGTVEYDKVQLEYCHIVSPVAGRVGLRLVDPGNTVFAGSGSTLVVITQLQPITVVFSVSEDDLPRVQAQLKGDNKLAVDVFDRSNDHLIESGTLTSLDNQVDTTTGTVRLRAGLANASLALFPNQFVNARLLVQTLKGITLVPTEAIQHGASGDFVYVVKPGDTVAVQTVTTLTTSEQDTAVQGLSAGVTVATNSFDRLENGVPVEIRGQGAKPQQGPAQQPPAQRPTAQQGPAQQPTAQQAQPRKAAAVQASNQRP